MILIDTILYNPAVYVYNVDLKRRVATVYNDLNKSVKEVALKGKEPYFISDEVTYYVPYLFLITEKRWNN